VFSDTPHAAIALVETSPRGGDYGELRDEATEIRVHIGTTELGLAVAQHDLSDAVGTGAEAGHIRLSVRRDGSVDLSTDGMAFLSCFWAEHQGRLLLSTHLASLVSLGLPADGDIEGLLQYLVMFHPLQQRTVLRHASLLPPGGHLRWRPGESARLTARPVFVPSDLAMSDDVALATYRALWSTVVHDVFHRNTRRRAVLALSGGLDSRAIATAAAGQGIRPLSYTYGDMRNREVVVARQVAQRLQLAHLTVPVTDDRVLPRADQIAERLDGAHGPAEMYESWFDDVLRSLADVIVNGLAGGPLWGDDKAVGSVDPAAVLRRTVARYAGEAAAVAPFLQTVNVDDLTDAIRNDIAASMSDWDFSTRSDAVIYWKLANRQLRWGNMLVSALRRAGLAVEAPFLDGRFLGFAARLTPEQRINGRLYLRAHREVLSPTADIPRSDDGNSPQSLSHVYWSGDSPYGRQLADLIRRHPISGARRGWRRSAQVGSDALRRHGRLVAPSNLLAQRASVFPADVWVSTRRAYADRLADLVEQAVGASSLLCDAHIERASAAIRVGDPPASAVTLAKVGTVGLWLKDYSAREKSVEQLALSRSGGG
jgi:asparagine synthase (glutamine-hydrolysing)